MQNKNRLSHETLAATSSDDYTQTSYINLSYNYPNKRM